MAYVSSSFGGAPRSAKGSGDLLKENIIFFLIAGFMIYAIQRFFAFLYSPFKDEKATDTRSYINGKQKAREAYLEAVEEDETDPMHQFQERYVANPEKYRKDPKNKSYKAWYEDWRAGRVIDTYLRWVPEIYCRKGDMRKGFIDYMKIQLVLHKKASFGTRIKFLRTIQKYYPEFIASMAGLENDLAQYDLMVAEGELKKILAKEINKFGLSEQIAEYLSEQKMKPEELKKAAETIKSFMDKGLCGSTSICAFENGLDETEAKVIEHVTVVMELPRRIALAYLKDDIDKDGLEALYDKARELRGYEDMDIFAPWKGEKSYYDAMLDEELADLKGRKRVQKYA
jgi:hypothetical protein